MCSRHQAEIEDDIVGCVRAVVIREWIPVSKCEAELGRFGLACEARSRIVKPHPASCLNSMTKRSCDAKMCLNGFSGWSCERMHC